MGVVGAHVFPDAWFRSDGRCCGGVFRGGSGVVAASAEGCVTGVRVKRRTEAAQHVGLSVTTVLKLTRDGKFPKPIKLTEKSVGWKVEDLDRWVNERTSA